MYVTESPEWTVLSPAVLVTLMLGRTSAMSMSALSFPVAVFPSLSVAVPVTSLVCVSPPLPATFPSNEQVGLSVSATFTTVTDAGKMTAWADSCMSLLPP